MIFIKAYLTNQNNPTAKRSGSNLQYFSYSNDDPLFIASHYAGPMSQTSYYNHRIIEYKDDEVDYFWFFGIQGNTQSMQHACLFDRKYNSITIKQCSLLADGGLYSSGAVIGENFYYGNANTKPNLNVFNLKTGVHIEKASGMSHTLLIPTDDGKSLYSPYLVISGANQGFLYKYTISTGVITNEFTTPANCEALGGYTHRHLFLNDDIIYAIPTHASSKSFTFDLKTKKFTVITTTISLNNGGTNPPYFSLDGDLLYLTDRSTGNRISFNIKTYVFNTAERTNLYGSFYDLNSDFWVTYNGTVLNGNTLIVDMKKNGHCGKNNILKNIVNLNGSNPSGYFVSGGLLFMMKDNKCSIYNFYRYTKVLELDKGDIVSASKFLFDDYGNMYEPFVENIMIENSNLYCYIQPDNEVTGYVK